MQGRAGAGAGGLRSQPRALPPPVLPPPPQFATDNEDMPANQIAQVTSGVTVMNKSTYTMKIFVKIPLNLTANFRLIYQSTRY